MVAREKARTWLTFGKGGHTAARCRKGGNKNLYAIDEEGSETLKKQMAVTRTYQHVACWKRARMNSGKRRSADEKSIR